MKRVQIVFPNGDSIMVRPPKPNIHLLNLSQAELDDREGMKLRRRKDYTKIRRALDLVEKHGYKFQRAARAAGINFEIIRTILRNREYQAKFNMTRAKYLFRKNGNNWPSTLKYRRRSVLGLT